MARKLATVHIESLGVNPGILLDVAVGFPHDQYRLYNDRADFDCADEQVPLAFLSITRMIRCFPRTCYWAQPSYPRMKMTTLARREANAIFGGGTGRLTIELWRPQIGSPRGWHCSGRRRPMSSRSPLARP
eukprot:scaffold107516_cov29-Tisochrysis_lutea.AAC.5